MQLTVPAGLLHYCCMLLVQKKQTPLHLAASAGKQAACDMLISLGAGVDSTDDFGQKPVS